MPQMNDQDTTDESTGEGKAQKPAALRVKLPKIFKACLGLLILVFGLGCLFLGYAYFSTPATIRKPAFQHLHFRMQLLVDGKAVDFASKAFQTETGKDVCSAQLTTQPFHFHDNNNQIVHVHWNGMTGGQLLKYYGWNYYGGLHGTLGLRFDHFPKLVNVPIHGNVLPAVPKGDNFYVFTGDQHSYKEQTFNNFIHQDFETFFGKKSNIPSGTTSFLDQLFPKAYADTVLQTTPTVTPSDQQLQQLNNLIGNVVIFVQKNHPTASQVQDRFNHLTPLPLSSCAG
jgi:hypothetical protein